MTLLTCTDERRAEKQTCDVSLSGTRSHDFGTYTHAGTPCTQTCTTRFRGNPSLRSAEHVPQRRDTTSVKIEVPGRGDPPPAVEGGRPKPKRLRTWVTAGDSGLNMHAIAVVTVSGPSEANFTPTSRQHRHPSDYKQQTSALSQLTKMDSSTASTLPPEAIAFAGRMYDAARQGDIEVFKQALPAGLPANMTNEKGDTLVCSHSNDIPR